MPSSRDVEAATWTSLGRGTAHEARELLRGEFQQLQEETNQCLATVLSAEQLQEFKAWSEERRQHMRERGGMRKHGRP